MTETIFWSAINISEGKKLDALASLAREIKDSGAHLADWSADADHNRSVFSLVGMGYELEPAIERIFSWAERHIDLSTHTGVHPRLGAVDVLPFVPLSPTNDLDGARQTAQKTAQFIAKKFNISAFLYRDSSSQKSPLTLPELRRGGMKALSEKMASGQLQPDFGPSEPHPKLGVTVLGARTPLTAFNCVLNTDDLALGREIAKELRASNGGVPHLQTLAFPLQSRKNSVQISMNILNPQETPVHIAYLAVCEACSSRGLDVVDSELIGLVPLDTLEKAFAHFLKLQSFHRQQIAEQNLPGSRSHETS